MTKQRPDRLTRNGLINVWLYAGIMVAALGCVAPVWARAAGSLYAGPSTDPVFTVITPHLLGAMFPEQRLDGVAVDDGAAAVQRVAAEPASAAIADLATMLGYLTEKKLPADRLEFHGPIGAHCAVAFARRDGWVRAFGDVVTAEGAPRPVIGIAGPDASALMNMLRRVEPNLATATIQSGLADEMAARVAQGSPDLLLLVAQPDLDHSLIERIANDEHLILLPVVTRLLARTAADPNSGFTLQSVQSDSGLTPWSRRPVTTLCTPTGVILRNDASPALRDAVNRAVPGVAASLRSSLTDRVTNAASGTLHDAVGSVQGLINRLRSD